MKHNIKTTLRPLVMGIGLLLASSPAFAQTVVLNGGLPNTGLPNSQASGDLSWADNQTSVTPGFSIDPGGSFSITGSGSYTVTHITVWDLINTGGSTAGMSLMGGLSGGSTFNTISSSYTATPASYGNGLGYVTQDGSDWPAATLQQLDFTVGVNLAAGQTYDFFLDGPYVNYPGVSELGDATYCNQFLMCANYGGQDDVLWLTTDGGSQSVSTSDGPNGVASGDAYAQVSVPDGGSALLLLGSSLAGLAFLRRRFGR